MPPDQASAEPPGWETIEAYLPQSERHDLIAELRSLTQGLIKAVDEPARLKSLQELNRRIRA